MDRPLDEGSPDAGEAMWEAGSDRDDWLDSAVNWTPWWATSIAVHGLAILLLMAVFIGTPLRAESEEVVVELSPIEKDPIVYPPIQQPETPQIFKTPTPSDEMLFIPNVELSTEAETNDESEFDETKGDPEFLSSKDFRGPSVCGEIGIAGGGGGKFGRGRGGNELKAKAGGGGNVTQAAVMAGLKWLARHQNPDGSWGCAGFHGPCNAFPKYPGSCDGPGYAEHDTGVTSLSLLAFLGAGYTHQSREVHDGICFGDVVKRSIQWLQAHQDSGGFVGGTSGKFMYDHAIAALALSEAYGLTGSSLFRESAQKSIDALLVAQNPYKGWRYTSKPGDNDTSVTGWAVMALKSAEISGLSTGRAGYDGAMTWLDSVTADNGRVGYVALTPDLTKVVVPGKNDKFEAHDSMTAVGVMSRIFIRKRENDGRRLEDGCRYLVQDLPVWTGDKVDFYYWYYASLALFQFDGPDGKYWRSWNEGMKNALVKNQCVQGCSDGSWPTVDRWSFEGGRVYGTAINVLTLEVYYRYDNVQWKR